MTGSEKKIGLFGGTFDPVHLGHLILAHDLIETGALDSLYFVPARQAPLRDGAPGATAGQRLELLQLAVADQESLGILDLELTRAGTSYTVDTVRLLRERWPRDTLYWIIGADQLAQLDQWKSIDVIGGLCEFLVLHRPGYPLQPPHSLPSAVCWHPVSQRSLEISSSEIRNRLREGRIARHLLPEAVARRVDELGLYQNSTKEMYQPIAYGSSS